MISVYRVTDLLLSSNHTNIFRNVIILQFYSSLIHCFHLNNPKSRIYLGGKLSPFLDTSKNSILEKQTLHKIHRQKNSLFTNFMTKKQNPHKIYDQKMDSSQNSVSE